MLKTRKFNETTKNFHRSQRWDKLLSTQSLFNRRWDFFYHNDDDHSLHLTTIPLEILDDWREGFSPRWRSSRDKLARDLYDGFSILRSHSPTQVSPHWYVRCGSPSYHSNPTWISQVWCNHHYSALHCIWLVVLRVWKSCGTDIILSLNYRDIRGSCANLSLYFVVRIDTILVQGAFSSSTYVESEAYDLGWTDFYLG